MRRWGKARQFVFHNISKSRTMKFLGLGQGFEHTLWAYVNNGRLKNSQYKIKVEAVRYGQCSGTPGVTIFGNFVKL